jgi:hypothetical protein
MDLCFIRGVEAREVLVASVFTFLVRVESPAGFRDDINRNALRCVSSAYNDAVLQRCRLKYHMFFAVQLGTSPMINRTGLPFREVPPAMFSFGNTQSRMLPYQHAYRHQFFAEHPLRCLDEDLYKYAIYPMPPTGEGRIADDVLGPCPTLLQGQGPALCSRMHFRAWRRRQREVRHELQTHTHMCTYPCCHHIFVVNRCNRCSNRQAHAAHCRPLCDDHSTPHIRRLFRRIIRPSTADLLWLAHETRTHNIKPD